MKIVPSEVVVGTIVLPSRVPKFCFLFYSTIKSTRSDPLGICDWGCTADIWWSIFSGGIRGNVRSSCSLALTVGVPTVFLDRASAAILS
jgi:hypothetical protein